jgi:electron transport complex protein RnfD
MEGKMERLYKMDSSPHIRTSETVEKVMYDVVIALIPAMLVAVYFFGMRALTVTLVAVAAAMASEAVCQKMMKEPIDVLDGSAIITGILYAFVVPVTLPYPIVILGSVVSIVLGKMVFGGLGHNIFNPALVGRIFVMISYPVAMTTWVGVDGVVGPTALAYVKNGLPIETVSGNVYLDIFVGRMGGSLGEVSALAILIGGIYLIIRGQIDWKLPAVILGTVVVICLATGQNPVEHLLTGGLFLGAFFMATDMVTSPYTTSGKIIFGIGIAAITMLIRLKGSYPEGVAFSILVMNGVTSIINKYTKPKKFGEVKK